MTMTADYFTATEALASAAEDRAVTEAPAIAYRTYLFTDQERVDLVTALSLNPITLYDRTPDGKPWTDDHVALALRLRGLALRLSR